MKCKLLPLLVFICVGLLSSCKKDSSPTTAAPPQSYDLEKGLISFSISGELQTAIIDTTAGTVMIPVRDSLDMHALTATLSFSSQVTAKLNNVAVSNGPVTFDFSQPVTLTLTSLNGRQSLNFSIEVQNELQFWGLKGSVISEKSLNKAYNFYYDQFDGSTFQSENCGPSVTTMAIKWTYPQFSRTVGYARSILEPQGGWWYIVDVQSYLGQNGIGNTIDTLKNIDSLVKTNIDHNKLMILCLDMFFVGQNLIDYQHTDKFYQTGGIGWGHFLLVKGYKQLSTGFFLEIYDPYSDGRRYPGFDNAQLKGLNRYYGDVGISLAAKNWWPYVMIVGSSGSQANSTGKLQLSSTGLHKAIPNARGQ